ncbi:hypothetical protein Scep_013898 [Stephania cephalantha]|uniref:Uncharacterized protein n=1 Tax=Stephania cephalantha TaxID=152367 RepID=A0AAP0IZZ0_9MAGN
MDEFASGVPSLSLKDQVLLDFGGDARKGVTVAAAASSSSSSSSTSSSLSSTSSSSCCAICLEKIELQEIALVKEEEDDDGVDDFYLGGSSSLRIGNRRWGSNGYVSTGRREARHMSHERFQDSDHAGSSRATPNKGKEVKIGNGRRAKRAMKREVADKANICQLPPPPLSLQKGQIGLSLPIVAREEVIDEHEEYYPYDDDDDDGMDDFYLDGSSRTPYCNRRWGSNGYLRTGVEKRGL